MRAEFYSEPCFELYGEVQILDSSPAKGYENEM
jgi:hypothetical protein